MMSRQQLHHLSGAYVLGALEPDEVRAFEERLPHWEDMRAEVVELADTAVALGLALPPVAPDPGVRPRLLAAVAATPQLPAVDGGASSDAGRPDSAGGATDVASRRRRLARRPRRTAALGALASLSAGALALIAALQFGPVPETAPLSAPQVLAADDARRLPLPVPGGEGIVLVYSEDLDASVLQWEAMPPVAEGQTYQFWYVADDARAAGFPDASAAVLLAGTWQPGDRVGITVEPTGGSVQPTGDVVALSEPLTA
ncbi:MAG: hypothetical protein JWP66_1586 [Naasia sp.]|nr:hypothetical protein [Naasia sp.]